MSQLFPFDSNDFQNLPATPCDMNAWNASFCRLRSADFQGLAVAIAQANGQNVVRLKDSQDAARNQLSSSFARPSRNRIKLEP
jgi:hypothetical protein